jgi:transmembrane sensor
MNETEQLIQKFWQGIISEEECSLLLAFLDQQHTDEHNALREAFFKMKAEGKIVLPAGKSDHILNKIHSKMDDSIRNMPEIPSRLVRMQTKRAWQIAAAVILLLCGGIAAQWALKKQRPVLQTAKHLPVLRTVTNNNDTAMTILLQDSSLVVLDPHSALSYYEPFGNASRPVSLSGKALFTVAKDAARPFTVYANGIATTALGTVFTVNTLELNTITVMLYEGKVVIKDAASSKSHLAHPVFLIPGQLFTINKLTDRYLVHTTMKETTAPASGAAAYRPANAVSQSFSNEPLASVFRQLNRRYKVTIQFDSSDVAGLYFTGTILNNDSLHTVLSAICNCNQLTFSWLRGHIRIQKLN